jgi:hypothetical protein
MAPDPRPEPSPSSGVPYSKMTPGERRTFKIVMTVTMVGLVAALGFGLSTLFTTCQATGDVVKAYAAEARAGKNPRPLRPDADTEETTRLLSKSTHVTVLNFIASSGGGTSHACVWTLVALPGKSVSMDFFLEERSDKWSVVTLSTKRSCKCPDGDPCTMP